MSKQTKIFVVVIAGVSMIGLMLGSGLIGFWIGNRRGMRRAMQMEDGAIMHIERLGMNRGIPLGERPLGDFHGMAGGVRSNTLIGDVQEIDEDNSVMMVLDLVSKEAWYVDLSDVESVEEEFDEVNVDEIEVGDHVMIVGEKDSKSGEMEAQRIVILEK